MLVNSQTQSININEEEKMSVLFQKISNILNIELAQLKIFNNQGAVHKYGHDKVIDHLSNHQDLLVFKSGNAKLLKLKPAIQFAAKLGCLEPFEGKETVREMMEDDYQGFVALIMQGIISCSKKNQCSSTLKKMNVKIDIKRKIKQDHNTSCKFNKLPAALFREIASYLTLFEILHTFNKINRDSHLAITNQNNFPLIIDDYNFWKKFPFRMGSVCNPHQYMNMIRLIKVLLEFDCTKTINIDSQFLVRYITPFMLNCHDFDQGICDCAESALYSCFPRVEIVTIHLHEFETRSNTWLMNMLNLKQLTQFTFSEPIPFNEPQDWYFILDWIYQMENLQRLIIQYMSGMDRCGAVRMTCDDMEDLICMDRLSMLTHVILKDVYSNLISHIVQELAPNMVTHLTASPVHQTSDLDEHCNWNIKRGICTNIREFVVENITFDSQTNTGFIQTIFKYGMTKLNKFKFYGQDEKELIAIIQFITKQLTKCKQIKYIGLGSSKFTCSNDFITEIISFVEGNSQTQHKIMVQIDGFDVEGNYQNLFIGNLSQLLSKLIAALKKFNYSEWIVAITLPAGPVFYVNTVKLDWNGNGQYVIYDKHGNIISEKYADKFKEFTIHSINNDTINFNEYIPEYNI